ncbi:hypothetical protein DSO57_1015547 [Entomophthora muscae]|uniref:Uncharacterized protein n=1 Tax=Entomophthora muscae TaxID=34485 RepID=A0ACC2S6W3_9FUNG|nr:hypothetical protein DSO57_1015547 [Entomophthora muscae]
MSGLSQDLAPYMLGAEIPEGHVLYQNMVISVPAYNNLSVQGFFQSPFSVPHVTEKMSEILSLTT